MSDNQFKCTAKEWYFVRPYVRVEMDSGVIKNKSKLKENFLKIGKHVMLFFVFNVVNGTIQILEVPFKPFISILLGVLSSIFAITSILTFINALKENREMYERLTNKPTLPNKEILLYDITKKGIFINYFNQSRKELMHFIQWQDIQEGEDMEIDHMRRIILTDNAKGKNRIEVDRAFKEAENQLGDFPFKPKLKHKNVRAIYLRMKNHRVSEIPIPPSWEENGDADRLIRIVEEYNRKK